VPRLRRHWPEALYLTYNRGLTARPVVLAKRTDPGRRTSRPKEDGPGRTVCSRFSLLLFLSFRQIQAIPAALDLGRRLGDAVSSRFLPFSFAR